MKNIPVTTKSDGYRIPMGLESPIQKNGVKYITKVVLRFSFLLQIVFVMCIYFWDYYAGQATAGFGVESDRYMGIGMFYIYVMAFFLSLIVLSAIFKANKVFGIGFMVFIPYAIIGFFVEYYYEIDVLKGVWAVFGWCLIGLLVGLSADISFKLLKEQTSLRERYVASLTGIIMNFTYFVLVAIALETFYLSGNGFSGPGSFLGVAYFGLPWMLIHGYFGGYLAWAMNHSC
jgi:hypothetical protein